MNNPPDWSGAAPAGEPGAAQPVVAAWPAPAQPTQPAYGRRAPKLLPKRIETYGLVLIVCGAIVVIWSLFSIVSAVLAGPFLKVYFSWLGSIAPHAGATQLLEPVNAFMDRIAWVGFARNVPYLLAGAALTWLGVRAYRKDRAAFGLVRTWCKVMFGIVAFATLLQVVFVIPATMDYTEELTRKMPHTSGAPFDVGAMTVSFTMASTVMGLVFGVFFLCGATIGLLVWTGRLKRESDAAGA